MKRKVIAKVKLNPGQGGYFDPITRIHLTHGDPEREVYAGINTDGLKAAVRNKRISLVSGSLGEFTPPFKLIKQSDGKIVLIANNPAKTTQSKTSNEQPKEVTPVKQEEVISAEPVKEQQQVSTDIPVQEVSIKQEVIAQDTSTTVVNDIKETVTEQDDVKTDKNDDSKANNPFKKNKKKGSKKEVTEDKTKID